MSDRDDGPTFPEVGSQSQFPDIQPAPDTEKSPPDHEDDGDLLLGGTDILDEEEQALQPEGPPDLKAVRRRAGNGSARDKQVNISFSSDELAQIDRAVAFLGGSRAELVRLCTLNSSLINYALERIEAIKTATAKSA